jgi:death on curing protein
MIWLDRNMVEAFHAESLARFGGADGLRDEELMLSALARPENTHAYDEAADIFPLAAAYCAGIIKNHPFIDGNKRTGLLAAFVFLGLNGITLEFDEAEIVVMIYGLAAGQIFEADIAAWLRNSTLTA